MQRARHNGVMGSTTRTLLRWLLGGALIGAGVGHLTTQREEFRAQVPDWFPVDDDLVVVGSGVAAFFVVIFPGNVAQWVEGTDAFGLDTDGKRFARLFFQPLLVVWALGSTGAWRAWRSGTWPHAADS